MNRLSRKEFKELLTEWNRNFINERHFDGAKFKTWNTGVPGDITEFIKSIDYPINLISLPFPEVFGLTQKTKVDDLILSIKKNGHVILDKNIKNFNHIKDATKRLYNSLTDDMVEYYDEDGEQIDIDVDKEDVINELENIFNRNKDIFINKNGHPTFVYYTQLMSGEDANFGGFYNFKDLKPDIQKSHVSWLLHHDMMHVLEGVLDRVNDSSFKEIPKEVYKSIEFFKVPHLETSAYNVDNVTSVMSRLVFKEEKEIDDYLNKYHVSLEDMKRQLDFHKIGRYHDESVISEFQNNIDNYENFKSKNIQNTKLYLKFFQRKIKDLFETKLKDKIIIGAFNALQFS